MKNKLPVFIAVPFLISAISIGIYFVLEKTPLSKEILPTAKHIVLNLYPEHYTDFKNRELWVQQLDDAYEVYQDLVGQAPFRGEKIIIQAVEDAHGAEMVSGNPIQWTDDYISDKLKSISDKNDLSFGPVHEMGHDFDIYFSSASYLIGSTAALNAEQWANFKLTYVADTLAGKYPDATFFQDSVGYLKIGEFSHKYFYEKYAKPWIESERKDWQNMNNDTFTGLLYLLKEQIGWEPFKKTFREYATFTFPPPSSDLAKVELFARTLNKYTNQDITPRFRSWGFEVYPQ